MVSWLRRWRKSFLLSIICHIALLIFFYKSIFLRPIGMHHAMIEHAYLFNAKNNNDDMHLTAHTKIEESLKAIQVRSIERIKKTSHSINQQIASQLKITPSVVQAENHLMLGIRSLLLEEIHDDIAHHLMYPDSAVSLDLSGIVMLKFLMLPTGVISQVTVVRSSGSFILDDAARSTLYAISPFKPAQHYLHEPDYFTIPVVFEMQ